ncbi:hypothetical protein SO802_025549 [Lithocarpus litseifolius]|uniref:LOB domain-containing protein n=1 Tax=Lithocarpus litseifolius TaxID=425828 RepID=A0AAW2BXD6_9ROSI
MSSSNSPCAACKLQRRKCTQDCVFAPYFPADQPQKFANVHNVFGASNVAKLLNELNPVQREDAVNSLAYEAEARLSDPVYGCVGIISILQYKLKQIQLSLYNAKQELARFSSGQAIHPTLYPPGLIPKLQHLDNPSSSSSVLPYIPTGADTHGSQLEIRDMQPQLQQQLQQQQHMLQMQQQIFEEQNMVAAVAAREQQEREFVRFNTGFDPPANLCSINPNGYNQRNDAAAAMSPLALGTFENPYPIQTQVAEPQHRLQPQPPQQGQQSQPQQPKLESKEGRS